MFIDSTTPEQRVANDVVNSILPTIKAMLPIIDSQENAWAANDILLKLQERLMTPGVNFKEETMGGFTLADWLEWSTVFYAFKNFADSNIEVQYPDGTTKSVKPRNIVNKFYTPKVVVP